MMTATMTQVEIPAGFAVVDVERDGAQYCYSMDFKPEYEAYGHAVTVYNSATGEAKVIGVPYAQWSEEFAEVDTAALDQWEAYTAEKKDWLGWFGTIIEVDHEVFDGQGNGWECETGEAVDVYRGRKCPKGRYTIVDRGSGQYGPWAHLRNESGEVVRFVSAENFRRPPEVVKAARYAEVMKRCPEGHGGTVWAFLFADSPTGEFSAEKLPFLCDYIEDGRLGEVPSAAGKLIRERFCK